MKERSAKPGFLRFLALAGLAAATVVAAAPASAQSNICARLQQDYLSAVRSGGGGGARGDVRTLRNQLAQAEAEARRKNCRRLGIFVRPAPDCPAVVGRINQLQRALNQAQGGGWNVARISPSQRDRLYGELRRNGCAVPSLGETASSGFRTICVRTCDGYYFPISFSASRSRMNVDEVVCKAMYGGAGAELFYHQNGRGAEGAVSLQGRPLVSEPYAFAYRRTFDASCQGELMRGLSNLHAAFQARRAAEKDDEPAAGGGGSTGMALPTPVARVNPAVDPETRVNLEGRFAVAPVAPEDEGEVAVAATVRRLGPDYYYRPPERIEALYEPPDYGPEFTLLSSAQASERAVGSDRATGSVH